MKNRLLVLLLTFVFFAAMSSAALAAPMLQGRPSAFDSGNSPGYYIWQDGDRWNVRTANNGMQHSFTGTVTTDGNFSDVVAQQSENSERIAMKVSRGQIGFQFNSAARNEGFSFTLQNSPNATFALYVDGRLVDTSNIYLGQQNWHPNSNAFTANSSIVYNTQPTGYYSLNNDYNNNYNNNYNSINNDYNYSNTSYGFPDNGSTDPSRFQGQPSALNPGNAIGYFVWLEGDRWFVKTTTRGLQRHFNGEITTGGVFDSLKYLDLEDNDTANLDQKGENQISFDFKTSGDTDGISFQSVRGADTSFTLYLDGGLIDPSNIYLGSQNVHPIANPFNLNSSNDQYTMNNSRIQQSNPVITYNTNPTYNTQSRFQGQPSTLYNGNVLGYFVWQEGDLWTLKTTTRGEQRQFTGSIGTNGSFNDVNRLDLESNDIVKLNAMSNNISFDLMTAGDLDGISFRLSNGADATFSLFLDGQPINPSNIFLGPQNLRPNANTFSLYSRDDQYTSLDNWSFPSTR